MDSVGSTLTEQNDCPQEVKVAYLTELWIDVKWNWK